MASLNITRDNANLKNFKAIKLILRGRIDSITAKDLRDALRGIDEGEAVVLDFKGVSYIASSGLREILIAAKRLGNDLIKLENVTPEVDAILKTSGFDAFINYTLKEPEAEQNNFKFNLQEMSLNDLLEYKVKSEGDKIFLKAGGFEYSWRDIDAGANAIAQELYNSGVRARSHVALCGVNTVNWVLTFFALQKLGAVAILLNNNQTPEEIIRLSHLGDITHFCLGNIPAFKNNYEEFINKILDPQNSLIHNVIDVRDSVNFMGRDVKDLSGLTRVMPDDICLMIFTSGSTGTPKGVLISANNLINASNYCVENLLMNDKDKTCAVLPLFHIFGLTSVLLASVISGAELILPQNSKPDELMQILSKEHCTILHSVPTVFLRLVNAPDFKPELASSLRASYLSGAPVSESQLEMLMQKLPNNHFVRRYGMSEITPVSRTRYDDSIEHIIKTVGKPIEDFEIKIVNNENQECKTGETGEILVQGRNLMCSYYKLAPDKQPFDAQGFLHTGDLGFLDDDGYLHFVGRSKELIIRGGENIMPDEVAEAISAHEDITEVKVMGVPDEIYGEAVAAAIVLREGASFNEDNMREFLLTKLSRFKIPSLYFIYDKLPVLSNGKIDGVTLKREILAKLNKN